MARKSLLKRAVSSFTALAIATVAMPVIPAFAEAGTVSYSFDGYDVEYSVKNEWTDGQSIEVKITNTGDEPILNWAFKYDAEGEINGLWNASVYDTKETSYIIKNVGWNYEIAPDASVSFGYTLSDYSGTNPDKFELCAKRVDKTEGYDVQYNITNEWDTGLQGEIVITNTSEEPLEAWELSFDSTFAINNLWNGRIISSEDNHYVVASEMWSNPISAGSSVTIGFTGDKVDETELTINNTKVSVVEISKLEEKPVEIDWEDDTDTDGDGLPDVYEIYAYETDPNNPDTDKDGLPDGYEAITLRTNPATVDSNVNGVNDGDEDFDDDGLSNLEEYQKETNPYVADTDKDGLKDGEEVHIYNTDPLKYDTDGDGVFDGDEVLLGLDPNNGSDGDTQVHQTVEEKDLYINRFNKIFQISIDAEASNNMKRFINGNVSRYSGVLTDNKSIIGMPICIEYNAGTISKGTITFRLDETFVNNNAHYYSDIEIGLDRYGVFCYDKVIGTIVPVPAKYDNNSNTITIDAQYMGDLMIIDYESLMYSLGVQPEDIAAKISEKTNGKSEEDDKEENHTDTNLVSTRSLKLNSNTSLTISDEASLNPTVKQVDLTLVVDTTGSMGSQIAVVKNNLLNLISKLRKDKISLQVAVVDYRDITCDGEHSTKVNNNKGADFYSSDADIESIVNSLTPAGGGDWEESTIDGLGAAESLSYRSGTAKFVFVITDAPYKFENNYDIANMADIAKKLKDKKIITSVITSSGCYGYYRELTETTKGKLLPMSNTFCDEMYKIITETVPFYSVVLGANIVSGFLDEPLVYGGSCNTDMDGYTDSEEVDWGKVKEKHEDGTFELFTWKELCESSTFWFIRTDAYADGVDSEWFSTMCDTKVLPVTSSPFSDDTDNDYYPDDKDKHKLEMDSMYIDDGKLDDSSFYGGVKADVIDTEEWTDGKFTGGTNAAYYVFNRRPNEMHTFTIKPVRTSFYKFKVGAYSPMVMVIHNNWYGNDFIDAEADGTYLLEKDAEYTIWISADYYRDYEIIVNQDNWVLAKDGGKWEPISYSNSSLMSNYLITGELYIPTIKILSAIAICNPNCTVEEIDPNQDLDSQIEAIIKSSGMRLTDDEKRSIAITLAGAAVTAAGSIIAAILVPVTGGGSETVWTVVLAVLSDTGEMLTYLGAVDALKTLSKGFEQYGFKRAFIEGDSNVCATKICGLWGRVWDGWKTAPYIRKISIMGDAGKVIKGLSDYDIINWCDWRITYNA